MKTAYLRFYEELNDLLPIEKRKIRFSHSFKNNPSIKDMIESLGIPHTQVDFILSNNRSVDFNYIVQNGDDISVYPVFESVNIQDVEKL
ncbi:MAG: twitching motility protein PilT, partial [Candidatus Cloacimonetes bacterium]|nr:twitching motility protein PilT [Candidatus Cloacimonadota bacterium]